MSRQDAIALVEATFGEWYTTLLRYAVRLTGHNRFAEDAVQDVFVRLYQELIAGRTVNNPRAWTLVVLRRNLRRQLKSHRDTSSLEDLPALASPAPPPGDDLESLLAALTPRESEVILLRLEGYKYEEIARELEISSNTVGTLLVRSMRKLRESVRSQEPATADPLRTTRKEERSEPLQ